MMYEVKKGEDDDDDDETKNSCLFFIRNFKCNFSMFSPLFSLLSLFLSVNSDLYVQCVYNIKLALKQVNSQVQFNIWSVCCWALRSLSFV